MQWDFDHRCGSLLIILAKLIQLRNHKSLNFKGFFYSASSLILGGQGVKQTPFLKDAQQNPQNPSDTQEHSAKENILVIYMYMLLHCSLKKEFETLSKRDLPPPMNPFETFF